jgi:hypothetical protein
MTSTATGDTGPSLGWINRELIASGKLQPHINVFGGEDRFWLGPEGGQFSIFFAQGAKFELADWQTPAAIDTLPWHVDLQGPDMAQVSAEFSVTNYSGTRFDLKVRRKISVLNREAAWLYLATHHLANLTDPVVSLPTGRGLPGTPPVSVQIIAYQSDNQIINAGKETWNKQTGLLSIWILGMFNPSPTTTIVVPIKVRS